MDSYNAWGLRVRTDDHTGPRADVTGMFSPVRCTWCQHVYDVGKVEVLQRYTDCSVWKCPGCNAQVDDRPAGIKVRSDIEWLNRDGTVRR